MDGRCSATNKDGRPCSAKVWKDGLCRWHSPEMAEKLADGRRRGGQGKSNASRARKQMTASTLGSDELRAVLGSTIARVLRGDIEPGVANAVAGLVRAYASLDEVAKAEELQRRLNDLERRAARSFA